MADPVFDPTSNFTTEAPEEAPAFNPNAGYQVEGQPQMHNINPIEGLPSAGGGSTPTYDDAQAAPPQTREQEFKDAVSGLDPSNYKAIESIPGVGRYVAPVLDRAAQIPEAIMQAPQYAADKLDDLTGQPIFNTALEMLMANAGEGSMEGAAGDSVKNFRAARAADAGDFSKIAPEAPAAAFQAPQPDPAVIDHQNAIKLKELIDKGYNEDYIQSQVPADPVTLRAVLHARDTGQPYGVVESHAPQADTPAPVQADPTQDTPFNAADQNAQQAASVPTELSDPLAAEAAAFKPKADPTVADAFVDDKVAADEPNIEAKLQAEADAFKAKQDAPAEEEPKFNPDEPAVQDPTDPNRIAAVQHANDVSNHIQDMTKDWSNAPETNIYPSIEDIKDPSLRAKFEDDPKTQTLGLIDQNGVHMIADRFDKPSDATSVFYHEALAHHGLASKFGDMLDQHLNDWYDNNHGQFRADVDDWMSKNKDAYGGDKTRAIEEVLAERAEKTGQLKMDIPAKIKQMVRQFGRRMGIVKDFSDDDIHAIMTMAHSAVVDGPESKAANAYKLSRSQRLDNSGEDDQFTYTNGSTNDFTRHTTADIIKATSDGDSAAGRSDWGGRMVDARKGSRQQVKDSKAFWDQKRANQTYDEAQGKFTSDGRNDWQTRMVDQRRGGRAQRAQDAEFWKGKKENKTPEQWEAENAGKFARRNRPDASDPETREGRVGGINLDHINTVHDINDVVDKMVETNKPHAPESFAQTEENARQLGFKVGQDGIKSGNTKVRDLPDLAARVTSLRQLHTNMMDRMANYWDKLQDNWDDVTHAQAQAHLVKTLMVDAQLRNDRTAIARALNAFKIVSSSSRSAAGSAAKMLADLKAEGGVMGDLSTKDGFTKFMTKYMAEATNKNPDGAAIMAQEVLKPYWWEKGLVIKNAAMLSGLGTQFKNTFDNAGLLSRDIMGHAVSMGYGKLTGRPGHISSTEMAGRMQGLFSALMDTHAHAHILQNIINGGREVDINGKFAEGGTPHPYVPVASHSLAVLEGADHLMKNFNMSMHLRGLGVRQALAEGLTGKEALDRGQDLAIQATPGMIARAEFNANQTIAEARQLEKGSPERDAAIQTATDQIARADKAREMMQNAQNQTKRSLLQDASGPLTKKFEALKAISPGMTGTEQAVAVAANVMFPFVRVADRSLARQLERSPLGVLKFFNRDLKEAVDSGSPEQKSVARSQVALGSAILAYYAYRHSQGKVTGENQNYKKVNALSPSGYAPNSVNDDGQYTDASAVSTTVNPFDLHNSTATSVASLLEAHKAGAPLSDTLKKLGQALVGVMNSNTVISNITPYGVGLGEIAKGDPEGKGAALGASLAGQFEPALIRGVNQSELDTTKRDTTGDKSLLGRTEGILKAGIPGLSKTLPVSYDVLGQPNDTGKSLTGMYNYNKKSDDPTVKELTRLENTDDNHVLLTSAPTSDWKMQGGTIKLTAENRSEFQKRSGQGFKAIADQLIQSPNWPDASVATKKALVKEALKESRKSAKASMLSDGTISKDQFVPADTSDEGIK